MSDAAWAAPPPGSVQAFAARMPTDTPLVTSASVPTTDNSLEPHRGSQSAPAYPTKDNLERATQDETRYKKKRKHRAATDPLPAETATEDTSTETETQDSQRGHGKTGHKKRRRTRDTAKEEDNMNVSDYNSEAEEAKLASTAAAAAAEKAKDADLSSGRGVEADPAPTSPPPQLVHTTSAVVPSRGAPPALTSTEGHTSPNKARGEPSPKGVLVSEAGPRAGSARASRSSVASATGSSRIPTPNYRPATHGEELFEEEMVSHPELHLPTTDVAVPANRAVASGSASTATGPGMPPLPPPQHLSGRARRMSQEPRGTDSIACQGEVVVPVLPATPVEDEEDAFSPRSPESTDIEVDAPEESEMHTGSGTGLVPAPPSGASRPSRAGRIWVSTTLPSDSTVSHPSLANRRATDLDGANEGTMTAYENRPSAFDAGDMSALRDLHAAYDSQPLAGSVSPLHVTEGSDWSHLDGSSSESSDDEDRADYPKQPFASCCVDRSNPDSWRQNPVRRNGLQRPLHTLQIIAFVIKVLGLGFFSSAVVPGYSLLYSDGHHDCLPEVIVFSVLTYGGFVVLAISWSIVTFKENGDYTNEGEVCMYCRRKTSESSKHCKACNKCVIGFDHHCKWLNMCVGGLNYRYFMMYVVSAVTAMMSSFVSGIVILARWWKELGAHNTYFRVGPILLSAILLVGTPPIIHLLGFHIMLNIRGLTTYEFIQMKRDKEHERALNQDSETADKKRKIGPFTCSKQKSASKKKKGTAAAQSDLQPLHGSTTAIPVR